MTPRRSCLPRVQICITTDPQASARPVSRPRGRRLDAIQLWPLAARLAGAFAVVDSGGRSGRADPRYASSPPTRHAGRVRSLGKPEALHWLSTRPHLRAVVSDRWLEKHGAEARGLRHPLYDLLQASPHQLDIEAMFDAIEAALAADVRGDVASRGRRLTSGSAGDYWSAVAELFVAAATRACGLEVTLGNPDVVVIDAADGSEVAIELTSVWQTQDTERLIEIIAGGWSGKSQPSIVIPDETAHVSTPVARRILAAMLEADNQLERSGRRTGDRVSVDISAIIEPKKVQAFLVLRSPNFVTSGSGGRSVMVDPWPDLEARVHGKVGQLSQTSCAIVAIDGTHMHRTAYPWADMVKEGHIDPVLDAPPNIAGVVLFWVDLRQHEPFRAVFVRNANCAGPDPAALIRTLHCLGTSRPRVVVKPTVKQLADMLGMRPPAEEQEEGASVKS
jgi:hypothetical protein